MRVNSWSAFRETVHYTQTIFYSHSILQTHFPFDNCTLYTVHCTLYTTLRQYSIHTVYFKLIFPLITVHCTLYTVHCTLYIVHCTLYTVHCTLHDTTLTLDSVRYWGGGGHFLTCLYFRIENIKQWIVPHFLYRCIIYVTLVKIIFYNFIWPYW